MIDGNVGERLRELRELTGYNQKQVALKLDLKPSAISHAETGRRDIRYKDLIKIHDLYAEDLGDNWIYICAGANHESENGIDRVLMLRALEEYLIKAEAFKSIAIKGSVKEIVSQFAQYLNDKLKSQPSSKPKITKLEQINS